jgi:cytochrome c-type biogenesis protein CcsB
MVLSILEENLVTGTFWAALISFLLFLTSIVTKGQNSEKSQITSTLGYIGMIFTCISAVSALVAKAVVTGHVPWSNFYESMILMTVLSTTLFLVVYRVYRHDYLGVIMSPAIVILIGIASILPKNFRGNDPLVPALQSYWIKIHTTSMIVSYSVFLLATTTAIAYLVLYAVLSGKEKTGNPAAGPSGINEVPAPQLSLASTGPSLSENTLNMVGSTTAETEINTVTTTAANRLAVSTNEKGPLKNNPNLNFFDELTYRLILLGFPILAFGIITGAMWANHAWGTYWSWDPKETAALMSWLFYAAYIHSRVGMSIRGKNSAILAIVGFAGIIFTYYGVNYLPGLHSYGFAVN